MPDYKLNIIGTFNNKKLVKALREAGVDVDKLGKKTKKTKEDMGRFRQATAGMRRTLGAVRNNLLLVTFAFGTLGAAIGKSVKDFAKFEKVNLGFRELGKSVGFSSEALNKLKQATDGTVSSMELMKQANNAMLLGIVESEDQMADMFDIAQRLASAVGQDATFGIESLTTGIGRQSRLMLDNLGIIVKTDEAYKSYAVQINKSVGELTEQEKKTAFITAAMDAAREKVDRLGSEQETVSMILSETSATIGELSIALGKVFSPAVVATARQITEWAESLRMLVFEFNILRGIELEEAEMLTLIDAKNKELNQSYRDLAKAQEQGISFWRWGIDAITFNEMAISNLKKQLEKLTQQYLAMLPEGESIAKNQEKISKNIGETTARLADLYPGMVLALDMYNQTKNAQIDLIESQMALIIADSLALEGQEGMEFALTRMGDVYDDLAEKLLKLIFVKKEDAKASKTQLTEQEKAAKKAKKAKEEQVQMSLQGANKMASAMVSLAKGNKQQAIAALHFSQAAAFASAVEGSMKAFAKGGIGGFIMSAAIFAEGLARVQQINQQIGEIKAIKAAATGADFVTSGPQLMMVGDNPGGGREHVQVTPLSSPNTDGPQSGTNITLNISAPLVDDTIVDTIIPAINEAVRRGETLAS